MPSTIDVTLPSITTDLNRQILLQLHAEGALHWPEGQTLFIADPHFGKVDSFRHAGIALPTSILGHDLLRLTQLLAWSQAKQLVILGDFFHTRESQSYNALSELQSWRKLHQGLRITLIAGNHDLHAGPPPAQLGIETVEAPYFLGPFWCKHHPQSDDDLEGYVLAGHLHPYVSLRDSDGSQLRMASFIIGQQQAILPAFGSFTGGSTYRPLRSDRVFVRAQGEVVEVSARGRQPSCQI